MTLTDIIALIDKATEERRGVPAANMAALLPAAREAATTIEQLQAALATPGCEAQGVRLVDLPRLAERVAEMADAMERVVGERDEARTALAKEEHAHGVTIDQRENAQSWADSLANQIASAADHDIGEHSNLNNPWDNAQDGLEKLIKERDSYRAFALDVARHLAAPDAEDLADKLTPDDLPALLDCVRSEYADGRLAGDHARFTRCITDLTRALGGDERRPETWEDLVASVRAVRQQRDYERQQANEWLAQLHDARAAMRAAAGVKS